MPYSEIRVSSAGYSPPDRLLKSLNLSQVFKTNSVTSDLPLLGSVPAPEGALCLLSRSVASHFVSGFTGFGKKS